MLYPVNFQVSLNCRRLLHFRFIGSNNRLHAQLYVLNHNPQSFRSFFKGTLSALNSQIIPQKMRAAKPLTISLLEIKIEFINDYLIFNLFNFLSASPAGTRLIAKPPPRAINSFTASLLVTKPLVMTYFSGAV